MIRITPDFEFEKMKTTDKCEMKCVICGSHYFMAKRTVLDIMQKKGTHPGVGLYCSFKCVAKARSEKMNTVKLKCTQCGKSVIRVHSHLKKIKNAFCSKSCAATYNNTHKTKGSRRSKLEIWLESKLTESYPSIKILYCDKTVINSELYIYVPSLNLAFELNGIYHYEPIYGDAKLSQIQNNDKRKFQACLEHGIELVLIDVSQLNYFKERNCQKYLDIIKNIIDTKQRGG